MQIGRHRPASAGNRRSNDRSKPIPALSFNFDRAAGRRKPNHSKSKPHAKVRQTARESGRPPGQRYRFGVSPAGIACRIALRRGRPRIDRPRRPALWRPAWWAPNGFAAIPTAALDPPHSAASPAVPALVGSGSPSKPAAAPPRRRTGVSALASDPALFCSVRYH